MLVMIVQAVSPMREIEGRISAQEFLIDLFLLDFKFHFGSAFKIINLE
jgi:hypothetical protein